MTAFLRIITDLHVFDSLKIATKRAMLMLRVCLWHWRLPQVCNEIPFLRDNLSVCILTKIFFRQETPGTTYPVRRLF